MLSAATLAAVPAEVVPALGVSLAAVVVPALAVITTAAAAEAGRLFSQSKAMA